MRLFSLVPSLADISASLAPRALPVSSFDYAPFNFASSLDFRLPETASLRSSGFFLCFASSAYVSLLSSSAVTNALPPSVHSAFLLPPCRHQPSSRSDGLVQPAYHFGRYPCRPPDSPSSLSPPSFQASVVPASPLSAVLLYATPSTCVLRVSRGRRSRRGGAFARPCCLLRPTIAPRAVARPPAISCLDRGLKRPSPLPSCLYRTSPRVFPFLVRIFTPCRSARIFSFAFSSFPPRIALAPSLSPSTFHPCLFN